MQRKYCSVKEPMTITSLGKTSIFKLLNANVIKSVKVLDRRLCDIESVTALGYKTNDNEPA